MQGDVELESVPISIQIWSAHQGLIALNDLQGVFQYSLLHKSTRFRRQRAYFSGRKYHGRTKFWLKSKQVDLTRLITRS